MCHGGHFYTIESVKTPSKNTPIYALVLAGGASSRLYPFNKILSDLTGGGKTLLQQALQRLPTFIKPQDRYVLTTTPLLKEMKRHLGWSSHRFLVDPVRRGTWPALLWAMAHLKQKGEGATLCVVPGDHVIGNIPEFRRAFQQATLLALSEETVAMIGVAPRDVPREWTGFGVFRRDPERLTQVNAFEEKPSESAALQKIQEGGWLWNAGMFFFRIAVAERALAKFQPAMASVYKEMCEALRRKDRSGAAALYAKFPAQIDHLNQEGRRVDNTIDYAIMAPLVARAGGALHASAAATALTRWNDVGQWLSLRELLKADRLGNVTLGQVRKGKSVLDSILAADRGCRINAEGVENAIVSVAKNRALVMLESDAPRIKEFTAGLGANAPRVVEIGCDQIRASAGPDGHLVVAGMQNLEITFQRNVLTLKPLHR